MTGDSLGQGPGLRLPPGVIQPFFLRHRRDDLHVMAFFEGQSEYEAVEAMIQNRPDGGFAIRAILTRHDQSQIDHINDDALLSEMSGARREVCPRPIRLELGPTERGRRARLTFKSYRDEEVALEVTTIGAPDVQGAGLTDPGGHSATSSLPLMWRGASTLAGVGTSVTIDNVGYAVPARAGVGPAGALQGYYSAPHSMGVIRAGTVDVRILSQPTRNEFGAEWVFDVVGTPVAWRVSARNADGDLVIEKGDGSGETVTASLADGRLAIRSIDLPGSRDSDGGLRLAFEDGHFSVAMEGVERLVTGRFEIEPTGGDAVIRLMPEEPAWAAARPVRVTCSSADSRLSFTTKIGYGN